VSTEQQQTDDRVRAVADALRDLDEAREWRQPADYADDARAAVATYERWLLDHQSDAERLARISDRAALRQVRGAAPVDPLVYARDVQALLAALAAETTRAEQAERRAVAAQGRASQHCARADDEEASWRLVKAELDALADRLGPLVDATAELLAALDEQLPLISRPNSRPRRIHAAADRLRHQLQRAQAR
jgi:hypothetical protein